jgi:hypothetical protein
LFFVVFVVVKIVIALSCCRQFVPLNTIAILDELCLLVGWSGNLVPQVKHLPPMGRHCKFQDSDELFLGVF